MESRHVALLPAGPAQSRGRWYSCSFVCFYLGVTYLKVEKKIQILPKGAKHTADVSPPSHFTPQFYSLETVIFGCPGFRFFRVVTNTSPTMYTVFFHSSLMRGGNWLTCTTHYIPFVSHLPLF